MYLQVMLVLHENIHDLGWAYMRSSSEKDVMAGNRSVSLAEILA
jgi:hypothetical protein